jgi:hypothetical protein
MYFRPGLSFRKRSYLLASAAIIALLTGPARANCSGGDCTVNTAADSTGISGQTSLRDALTYVDTYAASNPNASLSIVFAPSLAGDTITLGSPLPAIAISTASLTLNGLTGGMDIKVQGSGSIFNFSSGILFEIENVEAEGGSLDNFGGFNSNVNTITFIPGSLTVTVSNDSISTRPGNYFVASVGTINLYLNGTGYQVASPSTLSQAVSLGAQGGDIDTNGNATIVTGLVSGVGNLIKNGT